MKRSALQPKRSVITPINILQLLTALLLTIVIASCSKSSPVTPTPVTPVTPVKPVTPVTTQDVYVAGTVNKKATVWKNGVATPLTGGGVSTYATSLFVFGNDVYVGGYGIDANNMNSAVIWKNGTATTLNSNNSDAQVASIYVSASGVYAAGYTTITYQNNQPYPDNGMLTYRAATVWINGTPTVLSDGNKAFFDNNGLLQRGINTDRDSQANGIYFNGSNYFVAGNEDQGGYGQINAMLWKNQYKLILYNNIGGDYTANQPKGGFVGQFFSGDTSYVIPPTFSLSSKNNASAVFCANGSVYVAGYVTQGAQNGGIQVNAPHKATIWKDGVPKAIGDSTLFANPNTIYVSGTDVYAAGYSLQGGNFTPTLWKNGVATTLVASSPSAIAISMFVTGSDVYVAGNVFSGTANKGVIWKNGTATEFTDATNTTFVAAIFVK